MKWMFTNGGARIEIFVIAGGWACGENRRSEREGRDGVEVPVTTIANREGF